MELTAEKIWKYNQVSFHDQISTLPNINQATDYLHHCAVHFLNQGVSWDSVSYIRARMLCDINDKFNPKPVEEHKSPNGSSIRDPSRANEPDVAVIFKLSNWHRARKRIEDYNDLLIDNRKKKGHKLNQLLTGLIEYEAHLPPAE